MGIEADPERTMAEIDRLIHEYRPAIIGTDYGGGYDRNIALTKKYGIRRIFQYQYTAAKKKINYDKDLARFIVNRQAVMGDFFAAIKRGGVFEFPPWSEWEEPFAEDMIATVAEYNEARKAVVFNKVPGVPDDTLHSCIYAFLASLVRNPRPDIMAPTGYE
jgi:hypothetical protein